MAECHSIGIPPHVFWDYTPREIRNCFIGKSRELRELAKLQVLGAWHTANYSRVSPKKHLPDMMKAIRLLDPAEEREQSSEELRAAVLGWHSAAGGAVKYVPKGTIARESPWLQSLGLSGPT